VRLVYHKYTVGGLSIGAIARLLHGMGGPYPSAGSLGTIGRLGRSCATRPIRARPCFQQDASRPEAKGDQAVPLVGAGGPWGTRVAITNGPVTNGSKYRSRRLSAKRPSPWRPERLADNKRFAPRRTIEPSIVQGLVSCRKCGLCAVTDVGPHLRAQKSITTAASAPTLGAISAGGVRQSADPSRTCSTRSCGQEVFT